MIIEKTYLKGCFILTPEVIEDERGYFFENFNKKIFQKETGIYTNFVQDNESKSNKGVLRGLHFQKGDFAQSKLVRVVKGKVLDVCVDIRDNSPTFGKYLSIVLDDISHQQLYIPRGFAHGFLVLENDTIFSYKCDNFYNKNAESGIIYNDKDLNIDWKTTEGHYLISEKDKQLSTFKRLFNVK